MVYYKLVQDNKVVAVGTTNNLRKHQAKHNILLNCSEHEAQYIEIDGILYWDVWMKTPADSSLASFEKAEITAIEEEEYDTLSEAIRRDEVISAELEEIVGIIPDVQEEIGLDETGYSVEYIREVKIKELQLECARAITDGFDIELSDGKNHHFSMSTQDQMNLNSLYLQIISGATEVPYHADGEEEMLYSAEEMTEIINAANAHKVYNLAYFNSLKKWVNALRKSTTISEVKFGSVIPKKYQSAYFASLTGS